MIKIRDDIDFLVITGPTASGKTSLSIDIAKLHNGEVVNADSVQVYKDLDIGSAKITTDEMQGVKHYLLNIKEPSEEYTVSDFQSDCLEAIEIIKKKGKLPIVVGGPGLYLNSIIFEYNGIKNGIDINLKEELETYSNKDLYNLVKNEAQKYNIEIHENNRQRLIGYAYKVMKKLPLKEESLIRRNCQIICTLINRDLLYKVINKRVDDMLDSGLVAEVKQFSNDFPSQRAIGYKEVHQYLDGEYTYEEMVLKIKQHSRNLAKKQLTWINNQLEVQVIEMDKYANR